MNMYLKFLYNRLFRSKRSYSQLGEDLILDFYLRKISKGFYVDIGTNDPVYLNNTYLLYKKGWRGICVEPDAARCRLIRAIRRRDIVVNAGIGKQPGHMHFYEFNPDTLSTFSSHEAEEYKKLGHTQIGTKKIEIIPLAKLLQTYAQDQAIDLLSTDTEGMDMEILQSNDWSKFRPKMIVVEVVEYRRENSARIVEEFTGYLQQQRYTKFADTYINALYVDNAYAATAGLSL